MDSGTPVSYTHLDVYKRQDVTEMANEGENRLTVAVGNILEWDCLPVGHIEYVLSVSYTHLDVYKRQQKC